ncbi:phosphopantetheine-binding protein [Actinosynnema sp. NPDC023794]
MDRTKEVTAFICAEFAPDIPVASLPGDYDLVAGGVVDSLGLLKIIAWLESAHGVAVEDIDLDPDSFRTVNAITAFIEQGLRPEGIGSR